MKKIVFIGSLNVTTGGPALSTYLSMKALAQNNFLSSILMPTLNDKSLLISNEMEILEYNDYLKIKDLLNIHYNEIYCLSIQGIWSIAGCIGARFANSLNLPYTVTLRGMMYPNAMKKSCLKKKIALKLYQNKILKNSSCIIATCEDEYRYFRNLGFNTPVAILPNPIEIPIISERLFQKNDTIRIGYLGRLHERKRVERLIYALDYLKDKIDDIKLELIIIGADDIKYEIFLKSEVRRLGLNNVIFTGFLKGEEKNIMLNTLTYLAVPSDFENFGNVITEALVRGIPVIASKGTPWIDLINYNCGWWIDNDQNSLNNTIYEAVLLDKNILNQMSSNGKKLIKEKYSLEIIGKQLKELYNWIITKEKKPDFVHL